MRRLFGDLFLMENSLTLLVSVAPPPVSPFNWTPAAARTVSAPVLTWPQR